MFQYDFSVRELIRDILPPIVRRPITNAFLYIQLYPLKYIHDTLLQKRSTFLLEAKYNSQQMLLSSLLNRFYDPVFNRIRVYTPDALNLRVDAYEIGEGDVVEAYEMGEGDALLAYDIEDVSLHRFVVEVPSSVMFRRNEIAAQVEKYKLATKIFTIVEI